MPTLVAQRGARHPLIETGDQLYETPACAVEALLLHEPLPYAIWEPAAGRGAISRVLRQHCRYVFATDLVSYAGADADVIGGNNFFDFQTAPPGITCIVTNPPFKDADGFVRRGLLLVPKVVVLLRLAALEGAGRADLIDGHLARLWIGIERLPMMHRDGWAGRRISANAAPFAWFVFERQAADGFVGRRISWRT
jgi:hypothetical protein